MYIILIYYAYYTYFIIHVHNFTMMCIILYILHINKLVIIHTNAIAHLYRWELDKFHTSKVNLSGHIFTVHKIEWPPVLITAWHINMIFIIFGSQVKVDV